MRKANKQNGITLVALVITIIVLIILAGITISELTGDGLLNKVLKAREDNRKSTASETMKLKITAAQMQSYAEKQEMATLEYLYNYLKADEDMEYVELESKATATINESQLELEYIYAKLAAYPYEFGINSELELASINGTKVATATDSKIEQLESMIILQNEKITALEVALSETLTKQDAQSTYLTQSNASSTYATKAELSNVGKTSLAGTKIGECYYNSLTGKWVNTNNMNLSGYEYLYFEMKCPDDEATGGSLDGTFIKKDTFSELHNDLKKRLWLVNGGGNVYEAFSMYYSNNCVIVNTTYAPTNLKLIVYGYK